LRKKRFSRSIQLSVFKRVVDIGLRGKVGQQIANVLSFRDRVFQASRVAPGRSSHIDPRGSAADASSQTFVQRPGKMRKGRSSSGCSIQSCGATVPRCSKFASTRSNSEKYLLGLIARVLELGGDLLSGDIKNISGLLITWQAIHQRNTRKRQ
jgi:hypothetical protein